MTILMKNTEEKWLYELYIEGLGLGILYGFCQAMHVRISKPHSFITPESLCQHAPRRCEE